MALVKIVHDDVEGVAEVAEISLRHYLDKGWRLLNPAAAQVPPVPADNAASAAVVVAAAAAEPAAQ